LKRKFYLLSKYLHKMKVWFCRVSQIASPR